MALALASSLTERPEVRGALAHVARRRREFRALRLLACARDASASGERRRRRPRRNAEALADDTLIQLVRLRDEADEPAEKARSPLRSGKRALAAIGKRRSALLINWPPLKNRHARARPSSELKLAAATSLGF